MSDVDLQRLVTGLGWREPSTDLDERVGATLRSFADRQRRTRLVAALVAAGLAGVMSLAFEFEWRVTVRSLVAPADQGPAALSASGDWPLSFSLSFEYFERDPAADALIRFMSASNRLEAPMKCLQAIHQARLLTCSATPLERLPSLASSVLTFPSLSETGRPDNTEPGRKQ